MADTLLDQAQTLNKRINNTQQRVDTMQQDLEAQRLARERLDQAEAAKQKVQAEAVAVVQASRQQVQERQQNQPAVDGNVAIARMLEAGAAKRETRIQSRSRGTSEARYDYVTRTFTSEPAKVRDEAIVDVATKIKLDMGISPLGAEMPTVEPQVKKMTGDELASTVGESLPQAVRKSIEQSYGGSRALARYDQKVNTVIDDVTARISEATDSSGMVDKKKLYDLAANSQFFDPKTAVSVRKRLDEVESIENDRAKANIALKALVTETRQRELQNEALEMRGITGGALAKADQAIVGDSVKSIAPEISLYRKAGMEPQVQRYYLKNKIESSPDKDEARKSTQYKYGKELRPEADMRSTDTSSQPVAEQTDRLQAISSRIPDLYKEAVTNGEDIQSYIMDKVITQDGLSDLNDGEMFEFVGQVYDLVDGEVATRVNERASQLREVVTGQAKVVVEGAYVNKADDYMTGGGNIYDLLNREDYKNAGDEKSRRKIAMSFLSEKAKGDIDSMIQDSKDPFGYEATWMESEAIAGALKNGAMPEEADEYQALTETMDAFANFAEREFDTDGKRIAVETITIKNELASRGLGSAYQPMTIGGKVYGVPYDLFTRPVGQANGLFGQIGAERATMSLFQMLNSYGDNEYVSGLLKGLADSNGIITPEAGALSRLSRIVVPPSNATIAMYKDGVKDRVADAYASYPEQARERKVLDVADISSVAGEEADAPYTMKEYGDYIAPALASIKTVDGKENMDGAINALDSIFDTKGGIEGTWFETQKRKSASEYLKDGGLKEALWNNGYKDKAVALTYIAMKEDQERELAAVAMGGMSFNNQPIPGLKSRLESAIVNNPFIDNATTSSYQPMVNSLEAIKRQAETVSNFNTLIELRDSIKELAVSAGIDSVRTDRNAYKEKEKELASRFGGYNGKARMAPAVANEFAAMATEYKGDAKQRIDTVVQRADNVLRLYDEINEIIDARSGIAYSQSGVTYTTFGGKKYDIINPSSPVIVR